MAAGKYLTQMDLPLAAWKPSPPDRSGRGMRLARHHLNTRTVNHFLVALLRVPTRARFEIAAALIEEKFTPLYDRTAVTGALISRVLRDVKKK